MLKFRTLPFVLSTLMLLTGCVTSLSSDSSDLVQAKWLDFARDGIDFLDEDEFGDASASFNSALKLNIKNARLQALNGIAYHLSARKLDAVNYSLAEEGYKLSAKFDPSDWRTQYLLGLVNFEQHKFEAAKSHFIKAAVLNSGNDKIYYHLLAAAYYSMDFRLTLAVANHLAGRDLPAPVKSGVYKTCALIGAALSRARLADGCLARYRGLAPSSGNANRLADRMAVWKSLHQVAQESSTAFPAGSLLLAQSKSGKKVISDTKMVIVDVVIIGSREDNRSKTGINILDGLAFQFGDVADGVDAWNYSQNKSKDKDDSDNNSNVFSIIRTLTVPGISYSLNIINSADNQSKILAKPSLMALSGQKSVFFSGVNINAAATSGGTGDSVSIEKEIGVRLEVTPEFLSPGKVRLEVKAERTFLTDPSSSVVFDYRLDTTKTLVTSFVVLNMGETLVLGGLTEQEDTDILDGVPGLKNMPGLSVLFSEKIERRFKKSITILLTPRAPGTPAPTETPSVGAKPASLSDRNLMILLKNIGDDGKTFFPEDDRTFEFKRSVGRQFIGPEDIKYKAKNAEILETAKHFLGELEGSL